MRRSDERRTGSADRSWAVVRGCFLWLGTCAFSVPVLTLGSFQLSFEQQSNQGLLEAAQQPVGKMSRDQSLDREQSIQAVLPCTRV